MLEGRWFGTMALSEPQAGSSLADITTRAEPPGRRHLPADRQQDVDLRRRPRADREHRPPGAGQDPRRRRPASRASRCSSCRSTWSTTTARSASATTSSLAGLNHKMGYRGTTNTLLNFGEGVHARAGGPARSATSSASQHRGLTYMFHMMNEARIGVGLGATVLGYTGYLHALDYARTRTQGRPAGAKDPASPQVPIIEHADVRRMLLAQKSYVEGGAGARPLLRAAGRRGADRATTEARARRRAPAARHAHADRQELAVAVVPGRQRPRDPGARRLRLHPRLPGRAVLPRQPAQPDPRGHARHPGARPARPQGRDAAAAPGLALLGETIGATTAAGRAAPEWAGLRRRRSTPRSTGWAR